MTLVAVMVTTYIPSSVTIVNSYAFLDCSNLENVYFYGNAPTFSDNVFMNTSYANGNYLKSNTTWSSVVNDALYSNVTWVALDAMPEVPNIEEPVVPTVTVAPVVTNEPTPVNTETPGSDNTPAPSSTATTKPIVTSEPTHQSKMVKVEAVAATCTKSGCKEHWECAICGAMFSDAEGTKEVTKQDLLIPAIGHHVVTDAAVAATTTSTGLTEGTHCAICQRVLKVQSIIPKLPEVQSGFRYKEDTWKFTNPTSYIKPEIYEMFLSKKKAEEYQKDDDGTGGQCAGMAITVMASYCGFPTVGSYGTSFTCLDDLSQTDKSTETNCSALDYVKYGYVYQYFPSFSIARNKTKNDYEGLYNAIYDFQHNNGSPVYVSIGNSSGGHALVGLAISEDTDTHTKVLVYDCNHPNEQRYLTLTKSNGKYNGWSYDLASYLNWNSTNKNARINYVKLGTDFIDAFDPNKVKSSEGCLLLEVPKEGTGILFYSGENTNLSSIMLTQSEKVIPITRDCIEDTAKNNFVWLDGDNDISLSNLSSNSEISLTDDNATISAQSSSVSDMTIDMDKQSVEISDAGASTVTVNYETAEASSKTNVTSITGTSDGIVKMKQASNSDLIVTGMKECAITLSDETISETANTSETVLATKVTNMDANNSYKISTTETATQTTVTVSEDTNFDGTYDKVVATETKSESTVITKKAQKIKATTSKTFKVSKLKKKAGTFKIAAKASSGKKVTYKLVKGNKNIKFNAKTGVVTIKKGTKKGTYKIKVKMSVKGNSKYKLYSATKTISVKVRK